MREDGGEGEGEKERRGGLRGRERSERKMIDGGRERGSERRWRERESREDK